MKLRALRRALALLMVAVLCAGLLVGCGEGDTDEVKLTNEIEAQAGGSAVPFTEEFDTTQRFGSQIVGDTMCVTFNNVERLVTDYFVAGSDTLTLTASATAENEYNNSYRAILWKAVEGGAEYADSPEHPGTIEFTADGELYTAQFTGLEPGVQYKVRVAYDGRGKYHMSGQMSVQGIGGEEAPAAETGEA